LTGGLFALYVVEIDRVADQPDEDLLALYSHHQVLRTPRGDEVPGRADGSGAEMNARDLEGYEEAMKSIVNALPPERLEQLLAYLSPERRLAGLSPEQRLAGLSPEQVVLALPDDALRALSADYLARLSPATVAAIRKRLGQDAQ
jgi:hypothetical protein